jgi:L-ascorbate metabolism protein UlaG (beta-lactamase superfamily)
MFAFVIPFFMEPNWKGVDRLKACGSGRNLADEILSVQLPPNMIAIWALGQEGFLLKWNGRSVMFDPYLSNWVYELSGDPWRRKFDPPVRPEDCGFVDYVVCSHHHQDHMDKLTLQAIGQSNRTRFVVPKAHLPRMRSWGFPDERLIGISAGETIPLGEMRLEAHAAMHEQFATDAAGEHLFLGYVADFGGIHVYHAGDTVGFQGLVDGLKGKQIDIAMLPINGRDFVRNAKGIVGNCNYREAVEIAVSIGADLLIPMHYGLFPHNDENPAYFVDYLYSHYPEQKFHMFAPGERYIYMKTHS